MKKTITLLLLSLCFITPITQSAPLYYTVELNLYSAIEDIPGYLEAGLQDHYTFTYRTDFESSSYAQSLNPSVDPELIDQCYASRDCGIDKYYFQAEYIENGNIIGQTLITEYFTVEGWEGFLNTPISSLYFGHQNYGNYTGLGLGEAPSGWAVDFRPEVYYNGYTVGHARLVSINSAPPLVIPLPPSSFLFFTGLTALLMKNLTKRLTGSSQKTRLPS